MKKLFIIVLACTTLAAPLVHAQEWREPPRHNRKFDDRRPDVRHERHDARNQFNKKPRWAKGQRMNDWKRHQQVHDYKRRGLREPGRGQQWVKVDNDYILMSIATGVIAGLVTGSR